ncbi:hypothetical protein CMI37_16745 [Candidatus Pacearchaeota archaeon]|jgi:hypothetical protein|nr:hypothetical protein [Candidatus Pacearchaeota archaeon]|tara:strand:- start:479 stop:787 length:309 start_codon:yes stop_codon:yes gene_type:complete
MNLTSTEINRFKKLNQIAIGSVQLVQEKYYEAHAKQLEHCERINQYHLAYCCIDDWNCEKIADRDANTFDWIDPILIKEDQEKGISCECMELAEESTFWKDY